MCKSDDAYPSHIVKYFISVFILYHTYMLSIFYLNVTYIMTKSWVVGIWFGLNLDILFHIEPSLSWTSIVAIII